MDFADMVRGVSVIGTCHKALADRGLGVVGIVVEVM